MVDRKMEHMWYEDTRDNTGMEECVVGLQEKEQKYRGRTAERGVEVSNQ